MRRTSLLLLTGVCVFASLSARAVNREEILPAGTVIHCTLDEPNFSSKTAQVGDPVLCHLGSVSAFGHSVFPRGAMLSGHLQDSKDPGRLVGKGWLELEFDRIILPGAEVLPLQSKIIAAPKLKVDRDAWERSPDARRIGVDGASALADQDRHPPDAWTVPGFEGRVTTDDAADGRRRRADPEFGAGVDSRSAVGETEQLHADVLRAAAPGFDGYSWAGNSGSSFRPEFGCGANAFAAPGRAACDASERSDGGGQAGGAGCSPRRIGFPRTGILDSGQ
jgi:hypothetical protein